MFKWIKDWLGFEPVKTEVVKAAEQVKVEVPKVETAVSADLKEVEQKIAEAAGAPTPAKKPARARKPGTDTKKPKKVGTKK